MGNPHFQIRFFFPLNSSSTLTQSVLGMGKAKVPFSSNTIMFTLARTCHSEKKILESLYSITFSIEWKTN